jgi:O-antigen ligase
MKIKENSFADSCFKFFFYLFPFLLISGPFLPDLLVSILAIYSIIFYYLNKKFFFLRKKLVFLFLIFYFYININSFFSFSPLISFSTSLPYIRMILFSIFIAYLLSKVDNLKKIIFFSFLFSYLILFIDSVIQLKTGQNILGYPITTNRISSFFGDKLVMGSYLSRTLPILIAISYLVNFKQVNFLRALLICLSATLVFFSAERVSFFYFIMTVLLYLVLLPNKKQFLLYIALLTILFSLLHFIKPSTVDRVLKHTLFQLDEKKGSWFSERHEMHFITAHRMFLKNKFLGHGIKSFRYLCDQDPYSTRDLIESNNRNYSPIDGYYYLKSDFVINKTFVYYVLETQKLEFENISKNLEEAQMLKNLSKIKEAHENFYMFIKNNPIIALEIKNQVLNSIKSSSKVSKGEYVFSSNEFVNGCNTHPHSFHLQILSELGLLGYIFLFVFFIYLIFLFSKNFINIIFKRENSIKRNYNLYKIFIILALIQHLFPIIPSGNFFNNWLSILFYFKLGFLLNFLYYKKKC